MTDLRPLGPNEVGRVGPVTVTRQAGTRPPAGLAPPISPWECALETFAPLARRYSNFELEGFSYSPLTLRGAGDPIAARPARPKSSNGQGAEQ